MTDEAPDPNAELSQQPGWWVRLVGLELDLQALAASFGLPDVEVRQLDGSYYLRTSDFECCTEDQSEEVREIAVDVLRVLNGALRLDYESSREVHVDEVMRVHHDGRIVRVKPIGTAIEIRGRTHVSLKGGGLSLPARVTSKALDNEPARRALQIFGRDDLDHRDLYHVFDIAEAALGGRVYGAGTGITKTEVERFTRTAQSPAVLGSGARHGVEQGDPPKNPMSLDDSRSLIRRVLRNWLAK